MVGSDDSSVLARTANWKRTTKLLCQHFRWKLYMMRLSDPFYSCIKLRLTDNLQFNDLCEKNARLVFRYEISVLFFLQMALISNTLLYADSEGHFYYRGFDLECTRPSADSLNSRDTFCRCLEW